MTAFLRSVQARPGDSLVFTKDAAGDVHVRLSQGPVRPSINTEKLITLSGWTFVVEDD